MSNDKSTDAKTDRSVVLVTGASSGIGHATGRLFAEKGHKVVLTARRLGRLRQLADELTAQGCDAVVKRADLAEPGAADELCRWVEDECGRLDVLVNNAGFGRQDYFDEIEWATHEQMVRVNVLSLMALCHRAIPLMRRQGGGTIVNIASVGGVVAHPLNAVYCATKHAVVGLSKSLHLELKGTGIHVAVLCPGATKTEFFEQAAGSIPFHKLFQYAMAPPEKVARAVWLATICRRRSVIYPTLSAWFLAWMERYLEPVSRLGNLVYRDQVLALREQPQLPAEPERPQLEQT